MPGAFRHRLGQIVFQFSQPVAGLGADKEGLVEIRQLVQLDDMAQHLVLGGNINLVHDKNGLFRPVLDPLDDRGDLGAQAGSRVDQHHDDIGILGAFPGGGDHRPIKPAVGIDQGRFAGIGGADQGDYAAFLSHVYFSRNFRAASVSAA